MHDLPFDKKLMKLRPLLDNIDNRIPNFSINPEKQKEIIETNKTYFNRLRHQRSVYDIDKWEKDFRKSQYYKKNICIFPTIEFHKSIQAQIEKEKSNNENIYCNTTININNNLYNKTKFKAVKEYKPIKKVKKDDKNIDNEHFEVGETEIKKDDREFELYFVIIDKKTGKRNKRIKVNKCKKEQFFSDVVNKLCETDTSINKDNIKMDEFTIYGRSDENNYIDCNDTLEGNRLNGGEEIVVCFNNNDD